MSQWKSHRGDEWWYSDYWCEAEGSMASAEPASLTIESIATKAGQLTEERLHQLLWLTHKQFPEVQVQLSSRPEVFALLEALSANRQVSYRRVENPYSQDLRLLSISEPVVQSLRGRR